MTRTEFSFDTRSKPGSIGQSQDRLSLNPEIASTFPEHDRSHEPTPRSIARNGVLIDLSETIVTTVDDPTASEMNASSVMGASPESGDERADLRNAAERIWRLCLESIRPQLSAQTMRTWFEPLEATALEGSEMTLRAPSSFFCEWIGEHYQDMLEQSLRDVLGTQAKFRFDTASEVESANTKLQPAEDVAPTPIARPLPEQPRQHPTAGGFGTPMANMPFPQPSMRQGSSPAPTNGQPAGAKRPPIESNLNPRYTFDTFIRGESNKLAYAAAMAVANNPGGTRYNPLSIYGSVGLGKTHLIQAIGNAALQKFPSARVLYTSSDRFTVEFVDSIQNNKSNEFQALYRSIDVLIIDDVQFFAGKEKTQEIFFHTFNALRELGKQIILTCDRPPKELKDIDDRLLNRLQWGLTADIAAPDLETRIAILRHKAIADGIELSGEVIEYIATNISTNIRELEGCLISLLAISSLEGKEPTLELAREVLRKIAKRSTPILSIESIQRLVSRRFGIEEEALRAKTRRQEVVIARQVAMFLCKELTNHSLKSIGLHFGGRDHSTVIYAVQTIQEDMKRDPTIEKKIDELRRQLEMMQG